MAFQASSINQGLHFCFPYMEELKNCFIRDPVPNLTCRPQAEDYMECHNRKKLLQLYRDAEYQLRKGKVINVPYYNAGDDKFYFDDGRVIDNTDEMFKQFAAR